MSKTKQNRHESVATVMLSGKPVSIEDFHTVFKGTDLEKLMYRLTMYISMIRKDGGIIKPHRVNRKVTSYQLVNHTEFDSNGRYVGIQKVEPNTELMEEPIHD